MEEEEFKERIEKIEAMRHAREFEEAQRKIRKLKTQVYGEIPYEYTGGLFIEPVPIYLQRQISRIADEQGRIWQTIKEIDKARERFLIAFKMRKQTLEEMPDDKSIITDAAISAFQVAMIEYVAKKSREEILPLFEMAKPYLKKAIEVITVNEQTSEDVFYLGIMYQNLAFIEQTEENFETAISHYKAVLKLREEASDKRGIGLTIARIGECQVELAKKNLSNALRIFQEIGDQTRIEQVEKVARNFKLSLSSEMN